MLCTDQQIGGVIQLLRPLEQGVKITFPVARIAGQRLASSATCSYPSIQRWLSLMSGLARSAALLKPRDHIHVSVMPNGRHRVEDRRGADFETIVSQIKIVKFGG